MITNAEYTINGDTKQLKEKGNQTWSDTSQAPDESGVYPVMVMVENEAGQTTVVDHTDPRFNLNLSVRDSVNRHNINLMELLPEYLHDIREFKMIMETESDKFNDFYQNIDKSLDFHFVDQMSIEVLQRYETFLGIVGEGTIGQRRAYIKALYNKGDKLSETSIKAIVRSITGGRAVVKFFTGGEALNPNPGQGTLRVQVMSPDSNIDYKFDDIIRVIAPYMPAHLKLSILRYFATWQDIRGAYTSWNTIKEGAKDWKALNDYNPPEVLI